MILHAMASSFSLRHACSTLVKPFSTLKPVFETRRSFIKFLNILQTAEKSIELFFINLLSFKISIV